MFNYIKSKSIVRYCLKYLFSISIILFLSNCLNAQFVPGNLVVLVAGDGTTTLSSAASKITLKEVSKSGSTTGLKTVVLPTSISGSDRRVVQSGSATSEGHLTLSEDSRYLTCVGYDTTVGTASVVSLTIPKRIIARVDSLGTVNSSTQTTTYSGNNIRGAVTADGTSFWTSGANTGIANIAFGGSGAGTVVASTITNTRWINIMNGQLYVSSATGTYQSISSIGTGKPTSTGNTITALPGLPTTGGNSFGFLLLDRVKAVTGPDLLYVADQTLGILKYSFDGTTWTARGSVTGNAWGLAGFYNASTSKVELYVTLGTTANNALYKIEDAASSTSNISNTGTAITSAGTLLYSAGTNYILRGLAFAPYSNPFAPDLAVGTSGGGGICSGSNAGLKIGVIKSQRGINYQLKRGNSKVSSLLTGNGTALSFGSYTASGIYKVMAYNPLTNDSAFLQDSAVINTAKLVLTITQSDSVKCNQGNTGALTIGVSGGSGTYNYAWNDPSKQTTRKASNLKKGFYKVIVRDVWGCVDSAVGTINEPAKVVLSISKIDSVKCYQGSDGVITTSTVGGNSGYKYLWNDPSKQIASKAVNLKKGVYKLVVKDLYGCSDSISGTVNEPAKVTLSITKIDSVKCYQGSDGSITTSVLGGSSGYKYLWNDASKQTASKAINLKKGVYKLFVKDLYGCSDSISGTVNEPAKVTLSITKIDSVKCYQGSDGSITTSVSGGSSGYKYLWNDASKQTVSKAINLKKGVYKVVIKDLYGCSDSASGTVNEPAKVTISITKIDSVKCYQGSDGAITTSVSGGSKGYKYLWNDASKQTASKAINLKKGVYKVVIKDLYGCSDSASGAVNEPTKVSILISSIDSVNCFQGGDGSLITSTSGGSNGYKYNWDDPSKQTTSKAINLKKGIYKVVVKDVYGCSDSATASVSEPTKVTASIVAIDSVNCYLGSDGSVITAIVGGSKGYKYLWNDPMKQNTSKASGLKKGVYKLVVKDFYGCSDSLSVTISEPLKVVTKIISIDSVNCFQGSDGNIISSTSGGSNGYKYYWNDVSKQTTNVAKGLKKGNYKLIVKDLYGCSDSVVGNVYEPAKVAVSLVSIDSVNCFNGDDGSIVMKYFGGNNGFKFMWEDFTRNTTMITVDSKIFKLKKGNYRFTASDIYGCFDTLRATVNEPAKVVLKIVSIDSVNCFKGSDGSIITSISGGSNGNKFLWNDVNSQKTSKAIGLSKGNYKLVASDIYGCKDSITASVQEPVKVSVQVTQVDSGFCFGYSDGSVATATIGGTGSYRWKWNTTPTQTTPKAVGLKKGSYTVIVKDVYGCADSATGVVSDPEQIVPKIILKRLTMRGIPHDLSAVVTPKKNYKYDWKPTDVFFTVNTLPNPRLSFSETTKVELTVTDYKGCKGFDSLTIVVVQPLSEIMPTGFTPNLDNLNEGFGLPDIFEIQAFDVYDRWGEQVFRGGVTMPRWDGKINGDLAPVGTYSYTIQALLKGTDQIVKHGGSITLIR